MRSKSRNIKDWFFYYQVFLASGVMLFFFTRLDTYVVVAQLLRSPLGWVLPYVVLSLPLLLFKKLIFPSLLLLYWCLIYFGICLFSYAIFPISESSSQALLDRSFSALFLLVTTFLLMDQRVLHWARYMLLLATSIGIFNNAYQFINPSAFLGLVEGRATGFYLDPNDCASALIIGMMFTITLLPEKYAIPWILTVGFGVALTLSRSGMAIWIMVIFVMILTRLITPKQSLLWILVIGTLLFCAVPLLLQGDGGLDISNVLSSDALERVTGILDGSTLDDPAALERKAVATKAWELFLQNPVFGIGIGAMQDFRNTGFKVSTHNMFVLHLAEYGALGLLILPSAVFSVVFRARREARKIGITFSILILCGSPFAHTILDMRSFLTGFSLMAVMSASSQVSPNPSYSKQKF